MIRKITADLRARIATSRADSSMLDKTLSAGYDVCVVGSGPGGSVAAATLAETGISTSGRARPFLIGGAVQLSGSRYVQQAGSC